MRGKITRLVIVRHGETEWNLQNRFQGHLNSRLSQLGIKQAEAIAAVLSEGTFNVIYSSDLERAKYTADIIAGKLNMEVNTEADLREINMGLMQGLKKDEFILKYPEVIKNFHSDPGYVIPGGESKQQFYSRIVAALKKITDRHKYQNILLVAHGGVLDIAIRYTLDIPLHNKRKFSLYNAGINRFIIDDGGWKLETWGETCHLSGIPVIDDY
jgi:probable phosphoglycerate mutase